MGKYFLFSFALLLPTPPVMVYTFSRLLVASLLWMDVQPFGQLLAYLIWPFIPDTLWMTEPLIETQR